MSQGISRRNVLIGGLATGAAGLTALGATAPALAAPDPDAKGRPADLALTHVTVVDPARHRPQPNMTVLISRGRIVAVGRREEIAIERRTKVIDLTGKYLIPGLCDMHTHSIGSEMISPPLYALNGVTTVREMAGSPVVSGWRDKIESGQLLGPRWVIASPIVDGFPSLLVGPGEESPGIIPVANADEARRAVRKVKAAGADFVKLYSRVSAEAYLAIADEARRQRIQVAGHCPDLVPIEQAIDSGQRSIEHLHTLPLSTSRRHTEVRRALAAVTIEPGDYNRWFRQIHPIEWLAANNPSGSRTRAIFDRLVRKGTAVTPTIIMHQLLDMPEGAILDDERLKYVPTETRGFWSFVLEDFYKPGRTPEEMAQQRELYQHRLAFVAAMGKANVRVLAGSEAGLVYAYPGFSLHDELAELVKAGLTPLQALRSATTTPTEFLGIDREVGAIRRGQLADLVVLNGNPLADIRNTAKIHAVLVRGRLIDSAERERLLAAVADAASQPAESMPPAAAGCICHMPADPISKRVAR